jgi:hypothetical protein
MLIHFEPIKRRAAIHTKCVHCRRGIRRSKVFEETVNPYNRHPDGRTKTRAEVIQSVMDKAREWAANPPQFVCQKCAEAP